MYIDMNKPTQTIMFGKIHQRKGFWHEGRTLNENLLIFIISGSVTMQIENKEYTAFPGNVLLVESGTFYKPLHSDGCGYYFFHFTAKKCESEIKNNSLIVEYSPIKEQNDFAYRYVMSEKCIIRVDIFIQLKTRYKTEELLFEAEENSIYKDAMHFCVINRIMNILLINISDDLEISKGENSFVWKITEYINKNFKNRLSLSLISEHFNISKSYISRLFKSVLHTTATEYINKAKISEACRLLYETGMSILEISENIGFENQYYFSRVFRKYTNMTPSQFRKNRNGV